MKPLTVSVIEKIEVTVKWVGADCVLGFQFRGLDDSFDESKYATEYKCHEMNPDNLYEMILAMLKELMDSRSKIEMEVSH